VARWGGEEFVVVMPEATLEVARSVAERLRRKVASGPVTISGGGGDVIVTVSIGVAVTGDDVSTMDDLLRAADAAMYFAKRNGRNRVATIEDLTPRQIAANS
jgi:two-component system cell cycle response regulator